MRTAFALSIVVFAGWALGACTTGQAPLLTTGAINSPGAINQAAPEHPTRSTPAVAGRPARVFVMVGFMQKDCSAIVPDIKVLRAPTKGSVSFQPNQMTTVQFSQTGKCTGTRLPGTGIYYTARAGATGGDSFTVEATTPGGEVATRTFHVRVTD
jgi:hypothetical protein